MSQSWPLSQEANKSSGVCRVCLATRQLHLRDGTVHKHGPRDAPCPGSNTKPLSVSAQQGNFSVQPVSVTNSATASQVPPVPALDKPIWSPSGFALIKHIPKSARPACASHLASLLRSIVQYPSLVGKWLDLFNWGGAVLKPPKRGGKRHNLTSTIKKRISMPPAEETSDMPVEAIRRRNTPTIGQAVAAKLEDGNVRAAVRLLVSADTPAAPSEESLSKLKEKHPPASGKAGHLPAPQRDNCLMVEESEVRRAVLSFPTGSAGGPDFLRPQHIRDMMMCQESGHDFLAALTAFINLVLSGGCPSEVGPIFFGGRLLALNKKSGGVRPIAIGFSLRRLASKCASSFGINSLRSYFHPHQLGVGIPGGCEAAIHSARRYLEALPTDHVLVKLDFTNAFNSLHRYDMLLATHSRIPEIYAYCHSAYSQSSILFYGPYTISSEEGPQQGDPVGPLLFCNTIQPMLTSLKSQLNLGFLDDVSLGGPVNTVAADVAQIAKVGGEMGLHLNASKCELIAHQGASVTDDLLRSFLRVDVCNVSLLGAPLFHGAELDKSWSDRCDDLARAAERLSEIGSQDALVLLRSSFSAPKVLHLLRCAPSVSHSALQTFDSLLRDSVQRITNSNLSDIQWLQASLPVKDGGLGVRRVSSLAIPAFLASAASTLSLQADILSGCTCCDDSYFQAYLSLWSSNFGDIPDILPAKQPFWDRPGVQADRFLVESSLSSPFQRAAFLAASSPHSGDWLHALPIVTCGMRLDDEAVRVAIGLRLGLEICAPHQCQCGAQVDAYGRHGFVCKKAPGRSIRHHALNDLVARALSAADIPSLKEPQGLCRSDGKRPDGLTLVPWQSGKSLVWDVTVVCPLADSYVASAAREASSVAELAASKKMDKYTGLAANYHFQPIAVEMLGPINESASLFLTVLAKKISQRSGDERETAFLFQRISILLQRYNSILLHDSFIREDCPE